MAQSLTALEVVLQHSQTLCLFSIVGDDCTAAAHHLPCCAITVKLAEASPLAQLLVLWHTDQVDVVLSAQSLNQLLVVRLIAVLCQDAQLSLTLQAIDNRKEAFEHYFCRCAHSICSRDKPIRHVPAGWSAAGPGCHQTPVG